MLAPPSAASGAINTDRAEEGGDMLSSPVTTK
jgi:hypothetical protein